jgi:hypothetical protein
MEIIPHLRVFQCLGEAVHDPACKNDLDAGMFPLAFDK